MRDEAGGRAGDEARVGLEMRLGAGRAMRLGVGREMRLGAGRG